MLLRNPGIHLAPLCVMPYWSGFTGQLAETQLIHILPFFHS